jgi:hypothetical protein
MKRTPIALLILAAAACSAAGPADLIVHHAKVITLDPDSRIAEAIAVKDGRIAEVGDDEAIFRRWGGPGVRVVDAEGRALMPGLYDSHVHLEGSSTSESAGPLPEFRTLQDALDYVKARAAALPEGSWIVVPYAFPTRFKEPRFPTRAELDAVTTRHPVLYQAGPTGVANSKALQVSGITRATSNPPGGIVEKDPAGGEPTGMLRGSSALSLLKGVPSVSGSPSPEQRRAAVLQLLSAYHRAGITSVADRNTSRASLDLLLELRKAGALDMRVTISPSFSPRGTREEVARNLDALPGPDGRNGPSGAGDEFIRVGPIKLFLDGGMLNGSAYMREPWPKGPIYQIHKDDYHGLLFVEPAQLRVVLEEAAKRRWQMTAHTAGEGAMDVLLDAYADVDAKVGIRKLRWCITHANFPSARNLELCRKLGVTADVQPAWLYKDGATLLRVLGPERMRWFQPYKSWLKHTVIGGGSDHMIRLHPLTSTNPWDPWLGLWVAVTRAVENGAPLNPEEALTREEALRLYTVNNAFLHHEEGWKGTLAPGKVADFILLDQDPLTCPAGALPEIRVLGTWVGGRQVWKAP